MDIARGGPMYSAVLRGDVGQCCRASISCPSKFDLQLRAHGSTSFGLLERRNLSAVMIGFSFASVRQVVIDQEYS